MSDDGIDTIFRALRLLPEWDGNPSVLTRFIKLCDQLVLAYMNPAPGNELKNVAVINGILNKITGPAARFINTNGVSEDWNGIRNSLINNFSDQRDETALYHDLALLSQGQTTPQEYFEKCLNLFNIIMTYVTLHETVETTIEAKRSLYKKVTLQAYLRGLKDPLGSRIRCMRPETIEKALEFVQEELNTLHIQHRNESISQKKSPLNFQPYINSIPQASSSGPRFHGPSLALPPPQLTWRPNQFQNRGPTSTQLMFRAPPPNYNQQSNMFRSNRNMPSGSVFSPPRPMSGISNFVSRPLPPSGRDWRKYGNPPPTNYFKTREMNFNNCYDYGFQPYGNPEHYDYNNYSYPYYYETEDSESPAPATANGSDYAQVYENSEVMPNSDLNDTENVDFHIDRDKKSQK